MSAATRVITLIAAFAATGALAQGLADPTRPSAGWANAQARPAGNPPPVAAGPADAQIQVSSSGRRFVIIQGTVVHPGETYNGAKLLSVSDAGAVWQKDGVRESLNMSASVEKTPAASPGASRAVKKPKHEANGEKR